MSVISVELPELVTTARSANDRVAHSLIAVVTGIRGLSAALETLAEPELAELAELAHEIETEALAAFDVARETEALLADSHCPERDGHVESEAFDPSGRGQGLRVWRHGGDVT